MTLKIFLTGVTGYIGGDAFYALYEKHPEYEYAVLVRNEERAAPVKKAYPKVRIVLGGLEDASVIEKEAAAADVVIHTAGSADEEPSAKAIAKGLAEGHTPEKPGFWLHISGTGILQWYDMRNKRYGEAPLPDQDYHDIRDIDRVLSLPDDAIHRDIDKIVLGSNSPSVRTAIVGPPTIYGRGRGPTNQRSIQVPSLAEATQDASKNADPEILGPRAYYFVESGTHAWREVAGWVAEEAFKQGFLPAALTKEATMKEVLQSDGKANATWGYNSKSKAERARKYFGWEAESRSLREDIADTVAFEAKKLGIQPKEKKQ